MSRFGSWLRGPAKTDAPIHTQFLNAAEEAKYLNEALTAVSLIMDENMEGAEKALGAAHTSFNKLGLGVTVFMRALLGFEPEVMKAATEQLADAETATWADMKRAQKESGSFQSKIYPVGSEFALCYCEAMLMSAVVAVLNENLVEGIKGFYKMRKAFMILDGIMTVEHKYMTQRDGLNAGSSKTSLLSQKEGENMPGAFDDEVFVEQGPAPVSRSSSKPKIVDKVINQHISVHESSDTPDDSDLEFVDADEAHPGAQTPAKYLGHMVSEEDMKKLMDDISLSNDNTPESSDQDTSTDPISLARKKNNINHDVDSNVFSDPIDVFVHSGANLCYGLMLLLISMVPPAFSRLLSIIGFKGDRDRGIRMLWQSTKFPNINAAISGLVLLGYYNGLIGFSDIILEDSDDSGDNLTGFPKAKCIALLKDMRKRYPKSRLWRLEEARMQSGRRNLKEAIEILQQVDDGTMKQVAALCKFELSLNSMWVHNYSLSAESFMKCIELNNWSHCLYTYVAGCAYVEMYRDCQVSDLKAANTYREKAVELLKMAPTLAGKKRFMAKQLPFDVYVTRKVQKWEERAKEWSVDFVDAIGVSPVEEMIYLWNGPKRMNVSELETSLEKLDWGRTSHPEKHKANLDEVAIHTLLTACIFRNLGRFEEAKKTLQEGILDHDAQEFKGYLRDDWTNPSAHYEMAVIAWLERNLSKSNTKAKIAECEEWLGKVSKWEAYVLDARVGLKITTAVDTIKMYKQNQEAQQ